MECEERHHQDLRCERHESRQEEQRNQFEDQFDDQQRDLGEKEDRRVRRWMEDWREMKRQIWLLRRRHLSLDLCDEFRDFHLFRVRHDGDDVGLSCWEIPYYCLQQRMMMDGLFLIGVESCLESCLSASFSAYFPELFEALAAALFERDSPP